MKTQNDQLFANMLDSVIYLASLASNAKAVDPLLDPVRVITSTASPEGSQNARNMSILEETKQKLENYLVESDPVRVFTYEQLQRKIQDHQLGNRFSNLHKRLGIVITATVLVVALTWVFPSSLGTAARGQTAGFLALLTLSAGAAWFFITARKKFKAELKPAYTLLCISSLLLGLSQVQLPIVAYYNLSATPLFRYGGVGTPSFIAMICTYAAVRAYAKAMQLPRSLFTSLKIVLPTGAVLVIIAILIPHASQPQSKTLFDFSMGVMTANLFTVSLTSINASRIASVTTQLYTKAMRLLALAQVLAAIGLILFIVVLFKEGHLYGNTLGLVAIPFIISNVVWLAASYAFQKASEY